MVWYGILGFNVPLDTVQVISETGKVIDINQSVLLTYGSCKLD